MVDASPWGHFWGAIGEGSFDFPYFEWLIQQLPEDPNEIKAVLMDWAQRPPIDHIAETFTLLQAGAYSGKPIYIEDGR